MPSLSNYQQPCRSESLRRKLCRFCWWFAINWKNPQQRRVTRPLKLGRAHSRSLNETSCSSLICTTRIEVSQGGNIIWYCVNGMPQKDTLEKVAYTCMLSYPQFQLSPSGVTVVYLSQWVKFPPSIYTIAGIFKKSTGARQRVGIGLSYRPARQHI